MIQISNGGFPRRRAKRYNPSTNRTGAKDLPTLYQKGFRSLTASSTSQSKKDVQLLFLCCFLSVEVALMMNPATASSLRFLFLKFWWGSLDGLLLRRQPLHPSFVEKIAEPERRKEGAFSLLDLRTPSFIRPLQISKQARRVNPSFVLRMQLRSG